MTITPKGLGAENFVQIRQVWMGSSRALREVPASEVSYAPAVVVYQSIPCKVMCVYPLNPSYTEQMRDRLLWLTQDRPKPKTAGERYKARKDAKGLTFKFDDNIGAIFVADVNASPIGIPATDAGSLSFKSRLVDGTECVPFTREEFVRFADTLTRAMAVFEQG